MKRSTSGPEPLAPAPLPRMGEGRRRSVDWAQIQAEYRAAAASVREIAREHGISETAIRKRAKREGWVQDLTAQVRSEARARSLVRSAGSHEVRTPNARELVDAVANRLVDIEESQRTAVSDLLALARDYARELKAETEQGFPLHARAAVLKDLSATAKALIQLEREVWRMDEEAAGANEAASVVVAIAQSLYTEIDG